MVQLFKNSTSSLYTTYLLYRIFLILNVIIISLILRSLDLPRVSLKLGPTLKADNIKEGDDVYFECSIKAKPKAYKIEWKFNVSNICKVTDPTTFKWNGEIGLMVTSYQCVAI